MVSILGESISQVSLENELINFSSWQSKSQDRNFLSQIQNFLRM